MAQSNDPLFAPIPGADSRVVGGVQVDVVPAGSGRIAARYKNGTTVEFAAPQVVAIAPGHDGWVVGDEPAVLIEVDFLGETAAKFGLATPAK